MLDSFNVASTCIVHDIFPCKEEIKLPEIQNSGCDICRRGDIPR